MDYYIFEAWYTIFDYETKNKNKTKKRKKKFCYSCLKVKNMYTRMLVVNINDVSKVFFTIRVDCAWIWEKL